MNERQRRVGRNEALFRQVNEEIEALERGLGQAEEETFHVVCECGDLNCNERIELPLQAYERVRGDGSLFLLAPGHEDTAVEKVVGGTVSYNVVQKCAGEARQQAEATDPRH